MNNVREPSYQDFPISHKFMRLFIETLGKPNDFGTIFTNAFPAVIVLRFILKISQNRYFCLINFHKDPSLTNLP